MERDDLHGLGYALQLLALVLLRAPLQYVIAFRGDPYLPDGLLTTQALTCAFMLIVLVAGALLVHQRHLAPVALLLAILAGAWCTERHIDASDASDAATITARVLVWGLLPVLAYGAWRLAPTRWRPGPRPRAMAGGLLASNGIAFGLLALAGAWVAHPTTLGLGAVSWALSVSLGLAVAALMVRAGLELAGALPSLGRGRSRVTAYLWMAGLAMPLVSVALLVGDRVARGAWSDPSDLLATVVNTAVGIASPLVTRAFVGPPPLDEVPARRRDAVPALAWFVLLLAPGFVADVVQRNAYSEVERWVEIALAGAMLGAGVASLVGSPRAGQRFAIAGCLVAAGLAVSALTVRDEHAPYHAAILGAVAAQLGVLAWLLVPEPGPTLDEVFA